MSPSDERDGAALPPERAFVLQLRQNASGRADGFVGRIEHVTSGESSRFASLEEAVGFIARVLGERAARHPKHRD